MSAALLESMAGTTRLELATSAVTGQRSNQLNYVPKGVSSQWWALKDLNLRPFGCKPNALTAELSALLHSSYSMLGAPSTHRRAFLFCRDFFVPVPFFRRLDSNARAVFARFLHFICAASKLLIIHF